MEVLVGTDEKTQKRPNVFDTFKVMLHNNAWLNMLHKKHNNE